MTEPETAGPAGLPQEPDQALHHDQVALALARLINSNTAAELAQAASARVEELRAARLAALQQILAWLAGLGQPATPGLTTQLYFILASQTERFGRPRHDYRSDVTNRSAWIEAQCQELVAAGRAVRHGSAGAGQPPYYTAGPAPEVEPAVRRCLAALAWLPLASNRRLQNYLYLASEVLDARARPSLAPRLTPAELARVEDDLGSGFRALSLVETQAALLLGQLAAAGATEPGAGR